METDRRVTARPGGGREERASGPDSRPARREALEAFFLWAAALALTVGLSTWIGSRPSTAMQGVPSWAAWGVLAPWLVFFVLHLRLFLSRSHVGRGQ
ncbi:MAG: hypothetical protein OXN89_12340 [Bryobacterales bacterium]|nr:hypothetical protein [Bryobacterales bacterium]